MHELPIEHRSQTVVIDDDVAEPEVAVHDNTSPDRRPIRFEPTESELERRMRLTEFVEHLAVALDLIDLDNAGNARRVDRVDLGEGLRQLSRQLPACSVELVVAKHLACCRLAVDTSQDHVGRAERLAVRRRRRRASRSELRQLQRRELRRFRWPCRARRRRAGAAGSMAFRRLRIATCRGTPHPTDVSDR